MKYVLLNATILDGTKNMKPEKKNILVEDGLIKEIGTNINTKGIKTYDLSGKYLLPGLINLHVHLPGSGMPKDTKKQNKETVQKLLNNKITNKIVYSLCKKYAKTELLSGVTTIRTVGGLQDIDSRIRDSKSKMVPRILASNMAVSVPDGHMAGLLAYEAKTEGDAVKYVELISKTKPDLIKLMITGGVLDAKKRGEPGELKMPLEFVSAAVNKAHELGYKVAAHVESEQGIKVALEGGVDTIEHGASISTDTINEFKRLNRTLVATLSPAIPLARLPISYTNPTEIARYNANVLMDGMIECANSCVKEGITVGLGTDTACPFITHYDMWRELVYFELFCNVSKEFAIYTATLNNANIAGVGKYTGSVEVNKYADFLIVDNNPLESLEYLRTPSIVIHNGNIIKKPKVKKFKYVEDALDNYLKEIKNDIHYKG